MNYGNLVRRPFEIVARRPYLWILGLLAGGATTFNWSSSSNYRTSGGGPSTETLQAFWTGNWEWIVTLAGIALAIGIVWFILGCVATGGIIRAAVEHDDDHDYRFGTAWKAGYGTGWRIAGLRITVFALAVAAAIVVGGLAGATAAFSTTFVPAAVIFALLTAAAALASAAFYIVLGVACEMAERLVVLENRPVFESLGEGFRMVRYRFKELALGFLIMIAISIVAGIAMALVAVLVAVPAGIFGFGGWLTAGATGLIVAGSIAAVFFLGVILPVAGAYSAYSSVYWTLLFRAVRSMPAPQARGAIVPA
jgi:hypothetical protein